VKPLDPTALPGILDSATRREERTGVGARVL